MMRTVMVGVLCAGIAAAITAPIAAERGRETAWRAAAESFEELSAYSAVATTPLGPDILLLSRIDRHAVCRTPAEGRRRASCLIIER